MNPYRIFGAAARSAVALLLALAIVLDSSNALAKASAVDAAKATQAPAWPTFHGDYTLDGVARTKVADKLVRAFRYKAGSAIESTPIISGGKIIVTTRDSELIAIDMQGNEVWKYELKNDYFSAPPMATTSRVVVGTIDGILHCFNLDTGKPEWTYDTGGSLQGTANLVPLDDGAQAVIVNSQADGSIHCVSLDEGKRLWKTEGVDRADGSASVHNGKIVMGSCASALHVFSIDEAKKTADIELGADCQVAGGVAFAGNIAYVGTRAGTLCAVDVEAGKLVWVNEDIGAESFATPAVNDRFVIFGSVDGYVYGIDRASGKTLWKFDTEDDAESAVIAGDRVVVSAGGYLMVLTLDEGKLLFETEVSDWITSPAVVDGLVIVGADDGTVTAFGAAPAKKPGEAASPSKKSK